MTKLNWIACNGVKPDLPDGVKVHIIFREQGEIVENGPYGTTGWRWDNVICYALEPADLVQELVKSIKVLGLRSRGNGRIYSCQVDRVDAAIKAVEEAQNDE